ncbi:MAG: Rieske 2Fe-2S domain-containing protein [Porticoccus sp.]|nr:Rieske 2Fe-2S domain-containing protein [Porticoccus sp.]MBQ0807064.1 Rieske 2Fe-2S domain-containing protein [Porticoccus sp.]
MNFYPLEDISRISEGYLKCFAVAGQDMLLVHSGGQTRLIPNRCPHDGSPLKKGRLTNGCIQCPKHKITFRLDNGEPLGGEAVADISPLARYELVEEGGKVGIWVNSVS